MAEGKKELQVRNARRGFVPEDMWQFTGEMLEKLKGAAEDTRYLLKGEYSLDVEVVVIPDVDRTLQQLPGVVSSDAIILNHCESYMNIMPDIVSRLDGVWLIGLI